MNAWSRSKTKKTHECNNKLSELVILLETTNDDSFLLGRELIYIDDLVLILGWSDKAVHEGRNRVRIHLIGVGEGMLPQQHPFEGTCSLLKQISHRVRLQANGELGRGRPSNMRYQIPWFVARLKKYSEQSWGRRQRIMNWHQRGRHNIAEELMARFWLLSALR